jgi:cyclin-dependent kinase 12/13
MGCAFSTPKTDSRRKSATDRRRSRRSRSTDQRPVTDVRLRNEATEKNRGNKARPASTGDFPVSSPAAAMDRRKPRLDPCMMRNEQGWPTWLVEVAGDAIKGWTPRRANTFEKLSKIGQGTYSNVYKARDLISGKIVALKKVRFDNLEPESVKFMAREILVLRKLDHPNVVKLEGLVTSRMSCSLYLVFEYMEHDLAGLVACQGVKFTEPQVSFH